jgi:hypothetical protein
MADIAGRKLSWFLFWDIGFEIGFRRPLAGVRASSYRDLAKVTGKNATMLAATPEAGERSRKAEAGSRFYFLFPPSSAMYMISCLKIKRLGAPSRVSRTMCLS